MFALSTVRSLARSVHSVAKRIAVTGWATITPHGSDVPTVFNSVAKGVNPAQVIRVEDELNAPFPFVAAPIDTFPVSSAEDGVSNYSKWSTEVITSAFENAGWVPKVQGGYEAGQRTGVFMGTNFPNHTLLHHKYKMADYLAEDLLHLLPANIFIPALKAVGVQGPVQAVQAACSAGGVAITQGMNAIRRGHVDVALAGGIETIRDTHIGIRLFIKIGIIRPANADDPDTLESRSLAKNRPGIILPSEGASAVILEDWDHAVGRGADILGEVVGSGTFNCGRNMSMVPSDVASVMSMALKDAGVSPAELGYINVHATGTAVGDAAELKGIQEVFGHLGADGPSISATKPCHGHQLGGAGVLELIMALNAVRESLVPPTLHCKEVDPAGAGLNVVGVEPDGTPVAQEREMTYALSNSLGFGGINSSIIVKRV